MNAACPRCGRRAPVIYRAGSLRCTACGASRDFFSGMPVNAAGKPSKVGGAVATAAGVLVLFFGLSLALALGAVLQAIFPASIAGFAVGIPIAVLALVVGSVLLLGGRKLRRRGGVAELEARRRAVEAFASHQAGVVTAAGLGRALGVPPAQADAWLTELAKREGDRVALDVSDEGELRYLFAEYLPAASPWSPGLRVEGSRARFGAPGSGASASNASEDPELAALFEAESARHPARRATR